MNQTCQTLLRCPFQLLFPYLCLSLLNCIFHILEFLSQLRDATQKQKQQLTADQKTTATTKKQHHNSVEMIKQKVQKQKASLPEGTPGLRRTRRAQLATYAPKSARHAIVLQSFLAHCRERLRVKGWHTNIA